MICDKTRKLGKYVWPGSIHIIILKIAQKPVNNRLATYYVSGSNSDYQYRHSVGRPHPELNIHPIAWVPASAGTTVVLNWFYGYHHGK